MRLALTLSILPLFLATITQADTVYETDVIVIGGTCVGMDCVNGEVFSSDSLKLKENNTRISFGLPDQPGNFRLVANNGANGGENRFSIDVNRETSAPVSLNPQEIWGFYASVETDGRLKVSLKPTYVTVDGIDGNDIKASVPSDVLEYYLPAGSFVTSTYPWGDLYSISEVTQIEALDGAPINADVQYSAPVMSFSEETNSVTLGEGSEVVDGAVSVGSSTARRKITNLAAGTHNSDLLTYGQLTDYRAIANGMPLGALTRAIDSSFDKTNGISAMSVALSALQPNPKGAGRNNISVGVGAYDGQMALALGTHVFVGNNSTIKVGAASGGKSDVYQVSVGFGYSW
jgi:hypothetical protein